jgi:hypothetical protein
VGKTFPSTVPVILPNASSPCQWEKRSICTFAETTGRTIAFMDLTSSKTRFGCRVTCCFQDTYCLAIHADSLASNMHNRTSSQVPGGALWNYKSIRIRKVSARAICSAVGPSVFASKYRFFFAESIRPGSSSSSSQRRSISVPRVLVSLPRTFCGLIKWSASPSRLLPRVRPQASFPMRLLRSRLRS